MRRLVNYISIKMAGTGLILLCLSAFILLNNGFDLYEFSQMLLNWEFWPYFYFYPIITSLFIDIIYKKWMELEHMIKVLLHCLFGFFAFLPFGINPFTLIAGFVGLICAFIFCIGVYLATHLKMFRLIHAAIIPILIITIAHTDFTNKEGWTENLTDQSFHASFRFFHGEHRIPIHLAEGEKAAFTIDYHNMNGGGYGYHVKDGLNKHVGMHEIEEHAFWIQATEPGEYELVLEGDKLKGEISVTWEID